MTKKSIIIVSVFILGFVLGNISLKLPKLSDNYTPNPQIVEVIKRDTIIDTLIQRKKPIIIEKTATITIQRTDTIIQVNPFIAKLDTNAIGIDTLSIKYSFPANRFDFKAVLTPDTIKTINIEKEVLKTLYIEPKWYEKPSFVIPMTILSVFTIQQALK